jgi:hypothetical protein
MEVWMDRRTDTPPDSTRKSTKTDRRSGWRYGWTGGQIHHQIALGRALSTWIDRTESRALPTYMMYH